MTSGRYATDTRVSVERSKAEIEAILARYGADQFMYGWEASRAVIGFRYSGKKDCLWLGSNDESSTCARAAQEHNESQRPASGLSTRVERSPQLPTVGNLTATPSTTPPPTKLTQAPSGRKLH